MYPDLYKGLNLKSKDLSIYNSPLVRFDGRTVTPKGMIKLPMQTSDEVVEAEFIVVDTYSHFIIVDTYSPYIATLARP